MTTTLTQKYRDDLVALVREFQAQTGLPDSGVSRLCFRTDSEFVTKIVSGQSFMPWKAQRLEEWMHGVLWRIKREGADRVRDDLRDDLYQLVRKANRLGPPRARRIRPAALQAAE